MEDDGGVMLMITAPAKGGGKKDEEVAMPMCTDNVPTNSTAVAAAMNFFAPTSLPPRSHPDFTFIFLSSRLV